MAIKQIKTVSNLSQEEVNEFLAEAEIMVNMKVNFFLNTKKDFVSKMIYLSFSFFKKKIKSHMQM